ncbi:MAG: N-6 DNA methylase [Acidimicrobiales bacterium]
MALAGAVAHRVAAELGDPAARCLAVLAAPGERDHLVLGADEPEPPDGWADPWLVGLVHEVAAPTADRRARGAWYTPRPVVDGLLTLALGSGADLPALVLDPTCGGGAFLLAALDRLAGAGVEPAEALGRVAGLDVDPGAVQVTRWGLALWWLARRGSGPLPALDVERGDALAPWPPRWRQGPVLVIGNPPFATPLKQGTLPDVASRFRARRAGVLGPYADLAAIHLLQAAEQAAPGSTVALVQPQSVLAGRDTAGLREHLASVAPLRALWAAREAVFDAGVRACAVVLDVGGRAGSGPRDRVVIAHGPAVAVAGRRARASWGELAADALGAPSLPPALVGRSTARPARKRPARKPGPGRLADLVTATAGFRDEHYALVAACREAAAGEDADGRATARLVTVGAVDPLWIAWGTAPIRFGRRDWDRPVVDRHSLPPRIAGWLDRQLRPKVLLATQTRLLEPVVDRQGIVAPATPLIAVHAETDQLERVAAVLLAPPVVAWAWRRWFGTAMAIDAVKLAARQVGELPLPADQARWDEAAALLGTVTGAAPASDDPPGEGRAAARAVASEVARLMTGAYGAGPEVFDWWRDRLAAGPPVRRRSGAGTGRRPGPAPENG